MNLPTEIAEVLRPLFDALPIELAMPNLKGGEPSHRSLVDEILESAPFTNNLALASAICLYTGDLDRGHTIAQSISTETGSYWHGIMHRREGDYSNARYWIRQTAGHPLQELAPMELIAYVEAASDMADPSLLDRQRNEWEALFEWCAAQ